MYWTDLEDQTIYSANRLTGQDLSRVAEHLDNPLDLVVFHQQRQPPGGCGGETWGVACGRISPAPPLVRQIQNLGSHRNAASS